MNTITTLPEAETYLTQFLSSKGTYTLGRMQRLMNELGNPERKLRIIHVGGTAGKGSTCYMAAMILEQAGYTVGLHTSPHMISITERLMINRVPISETKFVQLLNDVMPAVDTVAKTNPDGSPTYYEITVAMMFKYFFDEKVDVAVIEVGLGGRLDGTNVLTPTVTVVNNVGLDHTEILGDTIEKIAQDKREIIKLGIPVVSAATQPSVRNLIAEKAADVKAPLSLLDRDFDIANIRCTQFTSIPNRPHAPPIEFDYVSDTLTIKNVHLALFGKHQATNAAVAITAVTHCGLPVKERAIREALESVDYIGRLEVMKMNDTQVLVDGAHNPMKMAALSRALTDHFPTLKFRVLFAVKGDKNISEMIRILAPHVSHWYPTTLERQTDWGKRVMYEADDLAKTISEADPKKTITVIPNFPKYLSTLKSSEPLLITGSLYLVGAIEEWKNIYGVRT